MSFETMVDMIKCHPSSFDEQISVPIFFSNIQSSSENDRLNILTNKKYWIGRCPGDPPRQLNAFDLPHTLQRKVFDQELSRYYPISSDTNTWLKIKAQQQQQQQRSGNKEPLKVTTVTPNLILSNIDATNWHLSDALSQHFTIKAEPLRPANNFINNSTNTLSSWQKYWTSTRTPKYRKEANDFEWPFPRSKPPHSNSVTTNFVTIRDLSSQKTTACNAPSRTPLTTENNSTTPKPSSPVVFNKQSSFIQEENQPFLPPLVLPDEKTPPMNFLKSMEAKSLSPIEYENTIIHDGNSEISTLTTQIYKLPLPSTRPELPKPILKRRSKSKSSEQKPVIPSTLIEKKHTISTISGLNTSVPKRKNPTSLNKSRRSMTKKQQQSLATVMTTTPRSKYEHTRWDEPYVGVRFDPPTPPSSPSSYPWSQENDHDENETPYQINYIHKVHL